MSPNQLILWVLCFFLFLTTLAPIIPPSLLLKDSQTLPNVWLMGLWVCSCQLLDEASLTTIILVSCENGNISLEITSFTSLAFIHSLIRLFVWFLTAMFGSIIGLWSIQPLGPWPPGGVRNRLALRALASSYYSFILSWGTSGMLPVTGSYEQSCCKHGWSSVLEVGGHVLWAYAQEWYSLVSK